MVNKTKGAEHREKLREQLFPGEEAWTGEGEKGWFRAPRTLPLVLGLIDSKDLSDTKRPSNVYLELWARNMGEGLIEMKNRRNTRIARGTSAREVSAPGKNG